MKGCKLYMLLLSIFILPGCVANEIKQKDKASIKEIGLIVLIRDHYQMQSVGVSIFNNKYNRVNSEPSVFVSAVADTASKYLRGRGHIVNTLSIDNGLRGEYTTSISNFLESKIQKLAAERNVDTIVLLYDGHCNIYPKDNFGHTSGLSVAGYGLATKFNTLAQQYTCLSLDVIKTKGFDTIVRRSEVSSEPYYDRYIHDSYLFKKGDDVITGEAKNKLDGALKKLFEKTTLSVLSGSRL